MKNKILIFIIGFLVGAIVATGGFLIYQKVNASNKTSNRFEERKNMRQMDGNMQMPFDKQNDSENGEEMTTPPELPADMQNGEQMTPPDMPVDNTTTTDSSKTQKSTSKNTSKNNSSKSNSKTSASEDL